MSNQNEPSWKRQVALFLISQNISLFGSSVVGFAILWHITLKTSSGIWIMLFTICSMLPQVFVSLFGGVWADRHNRKTLIMIADGFIALATLGLAIAFLSGFRSLGLLLAVSAVRSVGAGIQTPAVSAVYPQIVPQNHLTRVQGINQTLMSILMLISPAVGGIILGWVGIVGAFFTDVITAGIAVLVMSFIRVGKVEHTNKSDSILSDLLGGIKFTLNNTQLKALIICGGVSFFLITPAAVLTPLMVERSFGNEVWRLTANELVWTVGSLLGGALLAVQGEFKNKPRTVAVCIVAFGITFGLLGVSPNFIVYLVIMGISGFFLPHLTTSQTVYIQEITPQDMLGRVFSIEQLIYSIAMPAAILLFGPLADVVSVELILIISGGLLALTGTVYANNVRLMQRKTGL